MNKDWTGNNKAAYTVIGASNHSNGDREQNDYYATDPSSIDDLFNVEQFSDNILEPACGGGHLSKRMEELGKNVTSTDLIYRGYGTGEVNFLNETNNFNGDIITNPPYKYAEEFLLKSMEITNNKVAMFLKVTFLEGQKRRKMFQEHPPKVVYIYSKRKECAKNGEFDKYNSSAIAYAWYIWEKGYKGDTVIKWI